MLQVQPSQAGSSSLLNVSPYLTMCIIQRFCFTTSATAPHSPGFLNVNANIFKYFKLVGEAKKDAWVTVSTTEAPSSLIFLVNVIWNENTKWCSWFAAVFQRKKKVVFFCTCSFVGRNRHRKKDKSKAYLQANNLFLNDSITSCGERYF